jgi:flagellin FlaB
MFNIKQLHNEESGQTALETAIILIAFVVVASVFAFTILSAGSSSTEKGEEAIYAGLEGVQSSMSTKGAIIALEDDTTTGQVGKVVFTVSLVAGGDPVDLTKVVIGYRDENEMFNDVTFEKSTISGTEDDILRDGELVEITVTIPALTNPLKENMEFTLEVKPETGAVLNISRTTPAAVSPIMELR